jgi:hypothetical protein
MPGGGVPTGMSEEEQPSAPRRLLRTVTPPYGGRDDVEMDAIGWGYFLALLVLLVPLLPFVIVVWLITKLLDRVAPGRA